MKTTVTMGPEEIEEAVKMWVEREMRGGRVRRMEVVCPAPPDPPYATPEGARIEVEVDLPPRKWCGMRSHDWDCRCGGAGGDR